jgi:WD40 repeat protein
VVAQAELGHTLGGHVAPGLVATDGLQHALALLSRSACVSAWRDAGQVSTHRAWHRARIAGSTELDDQAMGTEHNREAALSKLLTELFDGDGTGLLRWVRLHLGKRIHDELSTGAPLSQLAFDSAIAIMRHGLAKQAFASLSKERPGQIERIQDIARLWGLTIHAGAAPEPVHETISSAASDRYGPLWEVPELPPHYLARPADVEQLERALLKPGGSAIGITGVSPISPPGADKHGLHGMGGIGKSVLAAAIARQPAIREHFPDGIFWLAVGQTPQLALLQAQFCRALGDAEVFDSISEGTQRLRELAADRAILVILDDVWDATHAQALDVVGRNGRVLVTTRDLEVLTWLDAREHCVDVLDPAQALALLADWTQVAEGALPPAAAGVARSCGYLPLALAMIGALVRRGRTWAEVQTWLDEAQLVRIQGRVPAYPYRNVLQAVDASVTALAAEHELARQCYIDLAVFPEDVPIPRPALRLLWSRHGLRPADADALADILVDRALARRDEADRVMLHDLQHLYTRSQVEDLAALHGELVDEYIARRRYAANDDYGSPFAGLGDGYFFQRLPWHLVEAGRHDALAALLFDFDWLDAKLPDTSVTDLLADFALLPASHEVNREAMLVHDALRLSSHVLARDARQLPGQLVGRLGGITQGNARITALLAQTRSMARYHWLRPVTPSLTPPGGPLLRTFAGHTDSVSAIAMTADGKRAISASMDGTLKLWDLEQGTELRSLAGREGSVRAVAMTPDGRRAISASVDGTLKLWDLEQGTELRSLPGHKSIVSAVAVTANCRRAVSASRDGTLKLWDMEQGTLRTLAGHTGGVWAVAVMPGGQHAVSASEDCTLKLWDLEQGTELRTLTGHAGTVLAVAMTLDGRRAVSASTDGTLKLWDLEQGIAVRTLDGHSGWVTAVAVTPDGRRAVSASDDRSVKVWDLERGVEQQTLVGHTSSVRAVAVTADGRRALSVSDDRTLKLWDLEQDAELRTPTNPTERLKAVMILPDERHAISVSYGGTVKLWDLEQGTDLRTLISRTNQIRSAAISADGRRVVSASDIGTLMLWDLEQGTEPRILANSTDWVESVGVTRDGLRAVSASDDFTLKLWDLETCTELRTLAGHADWVRAVAMSADGLRAVSASEDCTLKLWDLKQGSELCTLSGHFDWVLAVAVSPDGRRAVSGSADCTLKLWDLEQGSELRTLIGHAGSVLAVAMTPHGNRAISTSDDHSLKVWDLDTGQPLVTFTTDGAVTACACSPKAMVIVAGNVQGGFHVLELVEPTEGAPGKGACIRSAPSPTQERARRA